jgi:hypothetical protein
LTLPLHPAHEQRTALLDAIYEATPKDADGEMTGTAADAYSAVAYGSPRTSDRMNLYRHVTVAAVDGNPRGVTVRAWWWRCPTCGLVLPCGGPQ